MYIVYSSKVTVRVKSKLIKLRKISLQKIKSEYYC